MGDFSYQEAGEDAKIDSVPLAHLSVQIGQLHLADLADGDRQARETAERAAPWLDAAGRRIRKHFGQSARISTCFLLDDYLDDHTPARAGGSLPTPKEAIDILTAAADHAELRLDYLGRESGCAVAASHPHATARDRARLADIVTGMIVEEAGDGANGSRPPAARTGWLANGRRTPGVSVAMDSPQWQPPEEFGKDRHSVFIDVELWNRREDGDESDRVYSCSLLSAVWHLLRLGLLRDAGRAVALPYRFGAGEELPDSWDAMPTVTALSDMRAPFAAYLTLSMLPRRYQAAELAAQVIIDHLMLDEVVLAQTAERARHENLLLPDDTAARTSHLFLDGDHVLFDRG